jgi:alanine dehydrogenase
VIVKVKEPIAAEYGYLREPATLFTYLHLAADRALTDALLDAKVTAIAYETVEDTRGGLPLLMVIGAVRVPGPAAPKLVCREDLARLKPDALLIDVAIDQGGCFETSRLTTYDDPTHEVDGIVHSCVANMPGAVPCTSTRALTNATLPYLRRIAGLGADAALAADPGLARGLNTRAGALTRDAVAAAFA